MGANLIVPNVIHAFDYFAAAQSSLLVALFSVTLRLISSECQD